MASLPTGGERLPDEGQQRMRVRDQTRERDQARDHARDEEQPRQQRTSERTSTRPPAGQATEVDVIGNYKLGQEIGRGSFAAVYRGHHKDGKKLAAIKRVDKKRLSKKLLDNLESEISILKKLNHPHIVALKDCTKTEKFINIIMEYCSLGDLAGLIGKRDKMPGIHHSLTIVAQTYPSQPGAGLNEVLVRHFTKQLASALAFLRKDGLVHRDVKPQNLLLNPSPRYAAQNLDPVEMKSSRIAAGIDFLPVLKLADFGFARTLPEASMADTLCGSPLYMAPEILDYQKYDAMVDLWSCGTVLYEMMAGRPPYRAPNHIELLKKIQAGHDKVSFPSACVCSEELRQLARALLKQKPTQRMSFEELFSHPVITNDIPGLVHKTIEPPRSPVRSVEPIRQPEPEEPRRTSSDYRRTVADERAYGVDREQLAQREQRIARQPTLPPSQPAQPTKLDTSALPFATPLDKLQVPPSPNERPAEIRRYTTQTGRPSTPLSPNSQRPGLPAYATAPAREDLVIQRRGTGMERGPSRESNHNTSPGNSLLIHHREYDAQREREQLQRDLQQNARHLENLQLQQQQREQQEHRDLQRQRSKRGYNHPPSRELRSSEDDYVIVDKQQVQVNAFADELQTARRGGVTPPSANALVRRLSSGGSQQPRSPRGGRPSGEYVHPKGSYERKYGSSPGNAKSALARALEKANLRLFGGIGLSPPNQSPPNIGNTFPGAGPSSLILVNSNINEEDAAVLHVIEENANRADVVYSYAHVKYEQLIPSHPQGLGLVEGGVDIPTNSHRSAELTPDATIMAAEECLVLFVKVLSLLSKAMDVAHAWWATNGLHGEAMSAARANASQRMNNVVQWIRERFNEVLEKSDLVQSKIVEAQRDLPSSHPSHPGNLKKDAQTQQAGGVTSFALTTGVTAEKLMYDRALEMSRAAAVNELVGDDLQGCEVAYVTSLRLLEAILEKREDDGETVEEDDRRVIEKFLSNINNRYLQIKKKMDALARRSPVHSQHGSPGLQHLPPSPVTAPNSMAQR